MRNFQRKEKKQQAKTFETYYDKLSKCIVLKILDPEMYPFILEDPKAGIRTVRKTKNGNIVMN